MSSAPEDLAALVPRCRQLVAVELDLTKRERAVLNVVLDWSFARGREWAVFGTLADLATLAGVHRPDASNALVALQRKGVAHVKRGGGETWVRFLPSGALVAPETVLDRAEAAAAAARMERLNSMPPGFDPDGQRVMEAILRPTGAEAAQDDIARMSREMLCESPHDRGESPHDRGSDAAAGPAMAPHDRGERWEGPHDRPEEEDEEECSESLHGCSDSLRLNELIARSLGVECSDSLRSVAGAPIHVARAPAREHVHVLKPPPAEGMSHDHAPCAAGGGAWMPMRELEARLDDERRFALDQIAEWTGPDAPRFRKTWVLRALDNWPAVRAAVGEAKHKRLTGFRPRLGWGPFLNDLFHRTRIALRDASRTVRGWML
jgi:hypothetical protein